MEIAVRVVVEDSPGAKWLDLFREFWPAYRSWFTQEGIGARPTYMDSARALHEYMPELVPIWNELVELVGGGDSEARLLSLFCPAPYLTGCSQLALPGENPALIRNYDYSPRLWEGVVLRTHWCRPVLALSDSLWGVLDGINDAGLIVSLAFGGRRQTGEGFGMPLLLRYILETCDTTAQATEALERVPSHMSYNVTVVDTTGDFVTAQCAPDRATLLTSTPGATNHQGENEWPEYEERTGTRRRADLLHALSLRGLDVDALAAEFLHTPLYSGEFDRNYGTLYTSVYDARSRSVTLRWPTSRLEISLVQPVEQRHEVKLVQHPA